jgi:predicted amidohydrolase
MRIACIQSDVVFNDPSANAQKAALKLQEMKDAGVDLAVFPEAFLTGYCVDCQADADAIAIPRDHKSIRLIQDAANRLGIMVIFGFAELRNEKVYNTAALIETGEAPKFYSKTHLPILGLDNFVVGGDELPVFDTKLGRIGILICFDLRPPEPSRVLALKGADLIVLPTNWPQGAEVSADYMPISRAAENRVFFATCDRVGTENGFSFIGKSKIVSPSGKILASAGSSEEVIMADVDLAEARLKRNVVVPGKYETTVFECRRPELYAAITEAL